MWEQRRRAQNNVGWAEIILMVVIYTMLVVWVTHTFTAGTSEKHKLEDKQLGRRVELKQHAFERVKEQNKEISKRCEDLDLELTLLRVEHQELKEKTALLTSQLDQFHSRIKEWHAEIVDPKK